MRADVKGKGAVPDLNQPRTTRLLCRKRPARF